MRGTALRTERQTNVDLVDCKFEENSSNDIGSIFNRGTMTVINSVFKNNSGDVSFIIYLHPWLPLQFSSQNHFFSQLGWSHWVVQKFKYNSSQKLISR